MPVIANHVLRSYPLIIKESQPMPAPQASALPSPPFDPFDCGTSADEEELKAVAVLGYN
ncbi:hypothetical protein AB4156_39145 [Cupriavidus sp. 2MCAB6]|uniref:hypothetical protein n=1 Tax=Cupriavidus sp. 2MCAB6 TaxID=3232981 RepID=UPI003F93211A